MISTCFGYLGLLGGDLGLVSSYLGLVLQYKNKGVDAVLCNVAIGVWMVVMSQVTCVLDGGYVINLEHYLCHKTLGRFFTNSFLKERNQANIKTTFFY